MRLEAQFFNVPETEKNFFNLQPQVIPVLKIETTRALILKWINESVQRTNENVEYMMSSIQDNSIQMN